MYFFYMTSEVYEFYEFNWNEYLSIFSNFGYFPLRYPKLGHIPVTGWGRVLTYKSVQVFGQRLWSPNTVPDSV